MLSGYVVTTPKPLAEIPIINRTNDGDDPILAHWQVGLGKTVAFTSGMWPKWGTQWAAWPKYSKLWAQIVRWASRQSDAAAFNVATSLQDGRGRIRVEALDKNAGAIDSLAIAGRLVGPAPDFKSSRLRLVQTAPGVYEADFPARDPGNYLINLAYDAPGGSGDVPPLQGQMRTRRSSRIHRRRLLKVRQRTTSRKR